MSGQLTCSCGQVVKSSDSAPGVPQRCPECNAVLEPPEAASAATAPRRGLWSMMQQTPEKTADHAEAPATAETPASTAPSDHESTEPGPPTESSAEPAPPRGLWALMGQGTAAPPEDSPTDIDEPHTGDGDEDASTSGSPAEPIPAPQAEVPPADNDETDTAPRRGLWSLMQASTPTTGVQESEDNKASETPSDAVPSAAGVETKSASTRAESEELPETTAGAVTSEPASGVDFAPPDLPANPRLASRVVPRTGLSRRAVGSFVLGLIAVPLAALALLPQAWTKFPATAVGFAALVMGMLALSEVHRSRGRQTGTVWATAGLLLGTIAMFLGPLVFTRIGLQWRESTGREQTLAHLEQMGQALQSHHDAFGHYPAGETIDTDGDQQVSRHSWMTALLPFLGDSTDALYRQVDQQAAYDAPQNRPVMATDVPGYLTTTGASREKTARGLAVTHFAGVGGTILRPETGLVNAGIFDRGSKVSRGDVLDGLSQTLVIGEITHQNVFRPWGEPGNWRVAEKRLNTDLAGFGNFDGSGASFLRADGSVRFFSSATDPDVLQRLMTRDGGDFVREEDR